MSSGKYAPVMMVVDVTPPGWRSLKIEEMALCIAYVVTLRKVIELQATVHTLVVTVRADFEDIGITKLEAFRAQTKEAVVRALDDFNKNIKPKTPAGGQDE